MTPAEDDLFTIGMDLPDDLAARLRARHDRMAFMCAAKDNGQACCVDVLLDGYDDAH